MKKSLIALAALATVGAAQAQSSVTIYGVLDINTQAISSKSAPAENFGLVNQNSVATSRLGFRGLEDLGGGNSIQFNLEGCLNPNSSNSMGTTTAGNIFNREANVQLNNKAFGSLRLGTTDVTDAGNIEIIVSRIGNSGLNSVTDMDLDKTQVISYRSPQIGGFNFQVGHSNGQQTLTSTTVTTTGAVTSAFASYKQGPAEVYVGKAEQKGVAATADVKQSHFGLRVNAGFADIGAYYGTVQGMKPTVTSGVVALALNDPSSTGDTTKFKMTRITAAVPVKALGSGVNLGLLYGRDEASNASLNSGDSRITQGGLSKAFSKRTTGYVSYRVQNFESASVYDRRTTTVGVVHTF